MSKHIWALNISIHESLGACIYAMYIHSYIHICYVLSDWLMLNIDRFYKASYPRYMAYHYFPHYYKTEETLIFLNLAIFLNPFKYILSIPTIFKVNKEWLPRRVSPTSPSLQDIKQSFYLWYSLVFLIKVYLTCSCRWQGSNYISYFSAKISTGQENI